MSHRPGQIQHQLNIDIPLKERQQHRAELSVQQGTLWALLQKNARSADKEVGHA